MKLPKTALLQTAALRLAGQYVVVYAVVLGALFVLLEFVGRQAINGEVKEQLAHEFQRLGQAFAQGGVEQLSRFILQRYAADGQDSWVVLVTDQHGNKVAGNIEIWPSKEKLIPDRVVRGVWMVDDMFPRDIFAEDPFLPVMAGKLAEGHTLALALTTSQPTKLQEFAAHLREASAIALLMSLAMGVMLGRTLLKKVDTIRHTATMIVHGDLSQRIPLGTRADEFTALARQLNVMLERIEQLVKSMREVTDNIAHDLRSPLTRLRSRFDLTLLEARSPAAYRQAIVQGNAELGEVLRTFEALLAIAQVEGGSLSAQAEWFDVAEVAAGLAELYGPAMEDQGLTLTLQRSPDSNGNFAMQGSRLLVAQALN